MKKLILFIIVLITFLSCNEKYPDGKSYVNYDDYVCHSINELKSPVILIDKQNLVYHNSTNGDIDTTYNIVVKSNTKIYYYSCESNLVNLIGKKYNVNDTIR